jgi:hypothetical protein
MLMGIFLGKHELYILPLIFPPHHAFKHAYYYQYVHGIFEVFVFIQVLWHKIWWLEQSTQTHWTMSWDFILPFTQYKHSIFLPILSISRIKHSLFQFKQNLGCYRSDTTRSSTDICRTETPRDSTSCCRAATSQGSTEPQTAVHYSVHQRPRSTNCFKPDMPMCSTSWCM